MITVPEITEEIIKRSPFLEEALSIGIVNLSSLARTIQPEIQKRLYKDIKLGAIVMALKRLSKKLTVKKSKVSSILENISDLTVRSNITEFTFDNSPQLLEKQRQLLARISPDKSLFLTNTHGVFETSLFISSDLEGEVATIFQGETVRKKDGHLSAITLIIPKEATQVPGVYYSILKALAWEGINFVEVVSSLTELTIILEENAVDRAFSILKSFSKP